FRLAEIASAEEIQVVEHVVEVVEGGARLPARLERPRRFVGAIERGVEAAEEPRHGDVRLAVAEVDGGVEDHRRSIGRGAPIATPEAAVQQRGVWTVAWEQPVHPFQKLRTLFLQVSAVAIADGEIQLIPQAALAEEPDPVAVCLVDLWRHPYRVDAMPSEARCVDAMHAHELLTERR